jgi:tetratricopeptide (TPR) repeat protein
MMRKKILKQKKAILLGIFVFLLQGFLVCDQAFSGTLSNEQRKELALHYFRGIISFNSKYYDEALSEFQKASAIDPYYKETQSYIQESMKVLEEERKSLFKGVGESSVGRGDSETDYYFVGKTYYEKGDFKHALEAFKIALAKNPSDKYARYYVQLCQKALPKMKPLEKSSAAQEDGVKNISSLAKEVAYVKNDVKSQEEWAALQVRKAERRADRDELIRTKERRLKEEEEILEEEKQDYLAQEKITERATKIKNESEKWKNMKEKLASEEPGIPADLTEFPLYLNKADAYYAAMKESLRSSRWNSAGLNAIAGGLYYCDAVLIYFYNVKSSYPQHENINRLLLEYVKRADTQENVFHMRAILNVKKITEETDKPITRSQALFLSDELEKVREWSRSLLP